MPAEGAEGAPEEHEDAAEVAVAEDAEEDAEAEVEAAEDAAARLRAAQGPLSEVVCW